MLRNLGRISILLPVAIVLLAAFLRLYHLDVLPPGLHYDEAFNATMAQRVLTGIERTIFFREDLTEEPMAIYVTALSFALFGASPWSLRLVSALAGIVNVAALYFLARVLLQSRFAAALAAFVLAILYWHVNFSRLGMEPIFVPLTMTLAFAFLWRGLRHSLRLVPYTAHDDCRLPTADRRPPTAHASRITHHVSRIGSLIDFGLAGVFLATTQYTYKAALFAPVLAVAFIGAEILADKTFWRRNMRGLAVFVIVAILVFAPLGLYFATHPSEFFERPSTVTVTGISALADNALKAAGMFLVRGDENPRSNLPDRPALDPFLALGFVVGLAACVVRIRRTESRFLLLWLVIMALPSVLTDFAPHFGRSIGVTPAVAVITAYGFTTLVEQARRQNRLLFTVYGLLITGLAFSTFSTTRDYFDTWGTRTGSFDSFDVGLLTLAQKLRDRPANEAVYLSPVEQEHYTVRFGLAERDARSFDGRRVLVLAPPGVATAYGIVTREDARSLARLEKIFARGSTVETIHDFTSKPYAVIQRVEGAARIAPQRIVGARLGDVIELVGYDTVREGDAIALTVYWGSVAETRDNYTVFVHLVGAINPATGSPVWAQDDTRPGRGSYPTARWQAGEVVIDEYRLALPPNLPRGEYRIEIGMYTFETGARVRIIGTNGAPMESDRVVLERISLP
jgi:4-amino-4-deoxy-L-arabinose transferase-like glycosyltransferase